MTISSIIDFVLHLGDHLAVLSNEYGLWIYAILFLIIYCETGLVVTPFLPGDSLLFAAGSVAALGDMQAHLLVPLLIAAAFLGDNTNYMVGRLLGPRVFHYKSSRFFKPAYLDKTHRFFEKYGGKAVILARFVPIFRTYVPFTAGIGVMRYRHFIAYSLVGALIWIALFVYMGYWFGNIPIVKANFSLVVIAIIILSVMPIVFEYIKHKREQLKSDSKSSES